MSGEVPPAASFGKNKGANNVGFQGQHGKLEGGGGGDGGARKGGDGAQNEKESTPSKHHHQGHKSSVTNAGNSRWPAEAAATAGGAAVTTAKALGHSIVSFAGCQGRTPSTCRFEENLPLFQFRLHK